MAALGEVDQFFATQHASTWKDSFAATLAACTGLSTMKAETGMPQKVILEAKISGIPAPIKAAFPKQLYRSLYDGIIDIPDGKGEGMDGPVGRAKTFTHGAIAKRSLWAWMERAPEHWRWTDGLMPNPFGQFFWVKWPRTYSWLQGHATDQDGVSVLVKAMTRSKVLVVDDLGGEGMTKSQGQGIPFAHRVLNDVICDRYDNQKVILWTSNNVNEFEKIYDASMLSRLMEMSPIIIVEGDHLRTSKKPL
jgi:hypothetical protein